MHADWHPASHDDAAPSIHTTMSGDYEPTPPNPGKLSYTHFYNRLYPLLKSGTLNFSYLAEKSGFKERRIRETFLYRLGAGEVRQLFGLQARICYLCHAPVRIPNEPICLLCLERLDTLSRENTPPTETEERQTADEAALFPAEDIDIVLAQALNHLPLNQPENTNKMETNSESETPSENTQTEVPALGTSGFEPSERALPETTVALFPAESMEGNASTPSGEFVNDIGTGILWAGLPIPDPLNLFPFDEETASDASYSQSEEEASSPAAVTEMPRQAPRHFGFERVRSLI